MSEEPTDAQVQESQEDFGLDAEIADGGAALLLTAIGALSEDVAADAVQLRQDGQTVLVMRAERLAAFGVDVAALAKAIEVLGRRRDPPG